MLRICALCVCSIVVAKRVEQVVANHVEQDLDVSDAEAGKQHLNVSGYFKLDFVDVKKAETQFRGGDEPVLVPGEVVEMAFHNGYRDWALLTNWRVITVDGHTNAMTGFGKKAVPNKVTYSSKLWHVFNSAKVTTALGSLDRDVEVDLLPMGTSDFSAVPNHPVGAQQVTMILTAKIGTEKLFEVGEFVNKKIRAAEPNRIWMRSMGSKMAAMSWFGGGVPSIGRCKPDNRSLEEILGPSIGMVEKGETVLYKFHETFNPLRRFDDLIVTDKQVITVDQSAGKSRSSYMSYRFPADDNFKPWNYIASWSMTTAARRGIDIDCEMSATAHLGSALETKKIAFTFDRRYVSTADQFEMHSKLQDKIAKVWKPDFSSMK